MFFVNQKIKGMIFSVLFAGFCASGAAFWQLPDGRFHVWFLDVGQGDSIFIQTPQNHQILVDGGPGNKVLEELGEVMPFFDKSIDLIISTHPQADHISGLVEALKKYEVENVLFTGILYSNSYYDEFLREIYGQDIGVFIADWTTDFVFGEVKVDVLYPFEQIFLESFKEVNNSSIAIKIIYRDVEILLTGDMEKSAEMGLVNADINLRADILKAGHHGSKTSSTPEFLNKARPEIVVIQSGKNNSYGHPHKETLANIKSAGAKKIYRTDLDGRVEFTF